MYISNQVGCINPTDEVRVELIDNNKIKIVIAKKVSKFNDKGRWEFLTVDTVIFLDSVVADSLARDINNAIYAQLAVDEVY
jgi:hypothetical protein